MLWKYFMTIWGGMHRVRKDYSVLDISSYRWQEVSCTGYILYHLYPYYNMFSTNCVLSLTPSLTKTRAQVSKGPHQNWAYPSCSHNHLYTKSNRQYSPLYMPNIIIHVNEDMLIYSRKQHEKSTRAEKTIRTTRWKQSTCNDIYCCFPLVCLPGFSCL